MDKKLLKRALEQSLSTGMDDEETNQALDNLADSILRNLHREKAHVNVVVAEAFRSGGISELELLKTRLKKKSRCDKQSVINMIDNQIDKLK